MDWLDRDQSKVGPFGAEDRDYLQQQPPYRTPNSQQIWLSELVLLGIKLPPSLKQWVCTLPPGEGLQVSINQLQVPEILTALSLGRISLSQAQSAITQRPEKGYSEISELLDVLGLESEPEFLRQIISLQPSRYYQLTSQITYRDVFRGMQSLIWVDGHKGKVLQRKHGVLL